MKPVILAMCVLCVVSLGAISNISEPKITGIVPDRPTVDAKAIPVTVNGTDFRAGLTLQITTPGGSIKTLSGTDITAQRPVSFQALLAFDAEGTYEFVVLNSDGAKSPPFAVQAKRTLSRPSIDQVAPQEFTKSTEPQLVTLSGRNFAPGLRVSITDPTGTVTVVDRLEKVDGQAAVLKLTFEMSGAYALMVTNPSGESSNTVSITVR